MIIRHLVSSHPSERTHTNLSRRTQPHTRTHTYMNRYTYVHRHIQRERVTSKRWPSALVSAPAMNILQVALSLSRSVGIWWEPRAAPTLTLHICGERRSGSSPPSSASSCLAHHTYTRTPASPHPYDNQLFNYKFPYHLSSKALYAISTISSVHNIFLT